MAFIQDEDGEVYVAGPLPGYHFRLQCLHCGHRWDPEMDMHLDNLDLVCEQYETPGHPENISTVVAEVANDAGS
jgi:hypothetical protein